MVYGSERQPPDSGIKNIVTADHRYIFWYMDPGFFQRVNGSNSHHIILPGNGSKIFLFFQKLHSQLVSHGIFRVHPWKSTIHRLICSLDQYMTFQPFSFKLFYKTVYPSGTLPLPSGERRRNKRNVPMPQIQKMPRHQTANHSIILINGVHSGCFFFIADNNKRNLPCHFLNLFLKIRMRITGIDDSLRLYGADHTQIFFFQNSISLRITDKNTIPLLICHSLDALKQKHIIRTGQSGTKHHDQLFFFVVSCFSPSWKLIAQLSGSLFYPLHCFR